MQEREMVTTDDLGPDLEFVGNLEDVTQGWVGYTYDVSWGDRIP